MTQLTIENTCLWQTAFGVQPNDRQADRRASLRQKLLDLRGKVAALVAQIAKDIPNLTVHDITHLDALWETASLVAGSDFVINPAEAYVLGASILLHDAGMCLAAYPNRLNDLRETAEWRDTVASLLQQAGYEQITEDTLVQPPDSVLAGTIPEVLRLLHARQAKELPSITLKTAEGNSEYLIEDSSLRMFYGSVIGRIAYSHHVSVTQLEALLGQTIGAHSSLPSEWTVDPITIACLLRCADATHIDERRAPRFLKSLVCPSGVSADHWTFQSKLAKARVDMDALVYTSGPEFELEEADSWWLCFDTIRMISGELNDVDVLLENTRRPRFAVRRARGAESPVACASFIKTKGWTPVDAHLKVSDVPRLVQIFGGAHLYGNDLRIPIRELIQNASDAIRARRLLQNLGNVSGTILVTIKEEAAGYWLEIEDDGVGMSERTLTGSLLDFGKSFWSSEAVKQEFPGLIGKGMTATGRFGVGFFSVFMLGDFVKITSCRYDSDFSATKTLEFRSGLTMRPIVRDALPTEHLQRGGTRVSVRLRENPYAENGWLAQKAWFKSVPQRLSLRAILGPLCPTLDVNLSIQEGPQAAPVLASNDWIPIDGQEFIGRLRRAGYDNTDDKELAIPARHLRVLSEPDGRSVGRACIWGNTRIFSDSSGCVTVGGLEASRLNGIRGVLVGRVQTIARDSAMPIVSPRVLSAWASEQARILSQSSLSGDEKLNALAFVLQCGGDPEDLPIARMGNKHLDSKEFMDLVADRDGIEVYVGDEVEYDEDADDCHPREFKECFRVDSSIILVRKYMPTSLTVGSQHWPQCVVEPAFPDRPRSYLELVRSIISKAWAGEVDESEMKAEVGTVRGESVRREILVFSRMA